MTLRAYIEAAVRRYRRATRSTPWTGEDADLARTWAAVDATTRSIAFLRNYHEVRCCIGRRMNHLAAEGGEFRGQSK